MGKLLKNLTPAQWFAIIMAVLSAIGGATAQLTDMFGPTATKSIVSIANFATTIMSSILVSLTSQSAQISAVNAMPGVDSIIVNKNANATLAHIAVDPNTKVEASPEAKTAVEATAKQG